MLVGASLQRAHHLLRHHSGVLRGGDVSTHHPTVIRRLYSTRLTNVSKAPLSQPMSAPAYTTTCTPRLSLKSSSESTNVIGCPCHEAYVIYNFYTYCTVYLQAGFFYTRNTPTRLYHSSLIGLQPVSFNHSPQVKKCIKVYKSV